MQTLCAKINERRPVGQPSKDSLITLASWLERFVNSLKMQSTLANQDVQWNNLELLPLQPREKAGKEKQSPLLAIKCNVTSNGNPTKCAT